MPRNKSFANLLAARTVSTLGDIIVAVAVPFAVLNMAHSNSLDVGIVLAAELLGTFAFILVGGVSADRVFPTRRMVAADVASLATQLTIAALLATGAMTIPLFAALLFLKGIATGFFQPASRSLLPRIVTREELQRASGLLATTTSMALVGGPVLGGILVVASGATTAIALDAVTFAVSAVLLTRIPAPAHSEEARPGVADLEPRRPRSSFLHELRAGLREVTQRRWLSGSIAAASVTALLGSGPLLTVMPIVTRRSYGGATGFAWLVSAMAVGGIIGGLSVSRLKVSRPLLLGAALLPGIAAAPLALATSAPIALVVPAFGIAGLSQAIGAALWTVAVSRAVPLEALGRVSAWDGFAALALRPLGQALGGAMAGAFGLGVVLWMSAAVFAAMPFPLLALRDIRAPITTLEQRRRRPPPPSQAQNLRANELNATLT